MIPAAAGRLRCRHSSALLRPCLLSCFPAAAMPIRHHTPPIGLTCGTLGRHRSVLWRGFPAPAAPRLPRLHQLPLELPAINPAIHEPMLDLLREHGRSPAMAAPREAGPRSRREQDGTTDFASRLVGDPIPFLPTASSPLPLVDLQSPLAHPLAVSNFHAAVFLAHPKGFHRSLSIVYCRADESVDRGQ